MYLFCSIITLVSAGLGLAFSLAYALRGRGMVRDNALYWAARSAALLGLAVLPCVLPSPALLGAVTGAMLLVRLLDGIIGLWRGRVFNAAGPFALAALHALSLFFLFAV